MILTGFSQVSEKKVMHFFFMRIVLHVTLNHSISVSPEYGNLDWCVACISKPELFDGEMCLVSEETAVFTPCIVILITVTTITGVCP